MTKERVRDVLSGPLGPEYVEEKLAAGWRPVAVEWERQAEADGPMRVELPYGMRVADDCLYLEENAEEIAAMTLMLRLICEDRRLSEVAATLNARGYANRRGEPWTQTQIFYLLPRLIEVAPQIYSSEEWLSHKPHLQRLAQA